MGIEGILNFIGIDERTGLGGQPSEAQLRALPDAGYSLVINLAPTTVSDGTPIDEAGILGELGLDYVHVPVPWDAPEVSQYVRFVEAMDERGDRKALVHCAMNYRVTAFYALYAAQRLGWSEADADALIARIWESNSHVRMSDAWKQLIADVRAGHSDTP